jgi:hypothetical protein
LRACALFFIAGSFISITLEAKFDVLIPINFSYYLNLSVFDKNMLLYFVLSFSAAVNALTEA